jgi:hypothetical protein
VQNVVHRASRCSCSTTNECAFLRAVARACTNSGAASRSNRSTEHCAASREAEHTKGYYRIHHSLFFHAIVPQVKGISLSHGRRYFGACR